MVIFSEVANDIVILNQRLQYFERKYGILSSEFYQAFHDGALTEFDGMNEYHDEFLEWAALCQTRQKLRRAYQQLSKEQPTATRIRLRLNMAT